MSEKLDLRSLLPRALVTESDSRFLRRLLGEALERGDEALKKQNGRRSMFRPGPFWLLARKEPGIDDIRGFWNGEEIPDWPPWFGRHQHALRLDPLHGCVQFCLDHFSTAGVSEGRDFCRVIGAVAQTLCGTNIELAKRNRALALPIPDYRPPDSTSTEWREEREFVEQRPDESGVRLVIEHAVVWFGSHVGPTHADKYENQDAVWAVPCAGGLLFALADGVSTSLEARTASAMVAHRFCREAARLYEPSISIQQILLEAARSTQHELDEKLEKILTDPTGSEATDVLRRSAMGERTTWTVLENTKSGEKDFLQPAMASTLVGGFLLRGSTETQFQCTVLCVGDGAIELLTEEDTVDQKFTTDPEVTEIAESLSPGPRSKGVLEGEQLRILEFDLKAGQWMLISSDGLARGHANTIWQELSERVGDPREIVARSGESGAVRLLSDAAEAAVRGGEDHLFGDNLSIIIVEVK